MTPEKKIPTLRFSEFKEDWQEKRLGEICSSFKSGNNITSQNIDVIGQYPVYGGNGLRGFTNSFTHNGFYVLIGRQGALCGNINRSIGKSFISEHAIAVQANELNDNDWLAQKLELMSLNQYSESSAQPGLAVNKLIKLKIISPSLAEQQKIASFLTAVDKKIHQLTNKKALLHQYKKGVMQQIFSRQIRFKDENGKEYPKWEEKRLGEITSFMKGKNISKSDVDGDGVYECIRYGELYTEYSEVIKVIKSRTSLRQQDLIFSEHNDVLIPSSGETPIDIAKACCLLKKGVALGGDINILRSKVNGVFLSYYINNVKRIDIAKIAQGNSVVHLYSSQLSSLNVEVPSNEEQEKIADFLMHVDYKIEQVGKQVEQTQSFKKGLLQQMFV